MNQTTVTIPTLPSLTITALDNTNIESIAPTYEDGPVEFLIDEFDRGNSGLLDYGYTIACTKFAFAFKGSRAYGTGTIYNKDGKNILIIEEIREGFHIDGNVFEINRDFKEPYDYTLGRIELKTGDKPYKPEPIKTPIFKSVPTFKGKVEQLSSHFSHANSDVTRIMTYFCMLGQFEFITTKHVGNSITFYPRHTDLRLAVEFGNSVKYGIEYDHPVRGKCLAKITVDEFWTALLHDYAVNNKDYGIYDLVIAQNTLARTDYKSILDLYWTDQL